MEDAFAGITVECRACLESENDPTACGPPAGDQGNTGAACDGDPCGTGATCADAVAPSTGYSCTCGPGYEGTPTTDEAATCTDINGCDGDPCGTGATCADAVAPLTGYTCTCDSGYQACFDGSCVPDSENCPPPPCVHFTMETDCNFRADCTWNSANNICDEGGGNTGAACDGDPCGTGATCADAVAPSTGYSCTCDSGYQ